MNFIQCCLVDIRWRIECVLFCWREIKHLLQHKKRKQFTDNKDNENKKEENTLFIPKYVKLNKDVALSIHNQKGSLWYQAIYKNGKMNGEIKMWYENGALAWVVPYKDDHRHGVVKWYKRDGVRTEYLFDKGRTNDVGGFEKIEGK